MKNAWLVIPLLSFLLTYGSVRANHIAGGELLYSHISGNTYKISLTLYGECSGEAFYHLKVGQPRIKILNEHGDFSTLILKEEINKRLEVTNVCPQEANNTSCKTPQGTVPGITRFVYSAIVDLEPAAQWRLLFAGQLDTTGKSQTGLSTLVSNIKNNTGLDPHLYLEATLNNMDGVNSTPQYTTIPVPRYCIHQPQYYNQGAVDADKDELRFSLVPPIDINGIKTVYIPPYSATEPFAVQPGTLSYSSISGQMAFVPVKTEVAFVVNKVEEYRNGKLVGSSMRAMTFFMVDDCNNAAPYGNIDPATVTAGILHENTVNLCQGAERIIFAIPAYDNNNDDIQVTLSNIPSGAVATVLNNDSTSPVIMFEWDLSNTVPGNYTFFAQYNDGACPVPGNQTMAYTVRVARPFSIFHEVIKPTNCIGKQVIDFHLEGGIVPCRLRIMNSLNNIIAEYTDESGIVTDSFFTGLYKVLVYAGDLPCSTTYDFEVSDYGIYPYPPQFEDLHHCLYEPAGLLDPEPAPGGVVQWYDMNGERLSDVPAYTTDSISHFRWLLNQKVKVCESVFDTFDVFIHDYPDIKIQNEGGHVCVGDGMYLVATGGVRYEWQPSEKIEYYNHAPYTYVYGPQTYIVTGYSEYNCSATDTLVFDDIEQCCLFSYPSAFTPNGDGVNDGWHPMTYGNVESYLLSVYNRWGQRIFTSSDPKEKWNGKFYGEPCDIGSYYYFLKAICVTGREEKGSGSFVLLR